MSYGWTGKALTIKLRPKNLNCVDSIRRVKKYTNGINQRTF